MIQKYIHNLIDNLPDNIKKTSTPEKINIILSGGAFNGSYLIGALHFLKEMEQRKYVKVDKISACSIGSVCALLYHIEYSTSVPYSGSVTTRSAPSHPLNSFDCRLRCSLAPKNTKKIEILFNKYNISTSY